MPCEDGRNIFYLRQSESATPVEPPYAGLVGNWLAPIPLDGVLRTDGLMVQLGLITIDQKCHTPP